MTEYLVIYKDKKMRLKMKWVNVSMHTKGVHKRVAKIIKEEIPEVDVLLYMFPHSECLRAGKRADKIERYIK
ncbi:hypothetical protein DRQ16_04890 [bacterium]|nr:MAG: hypothetical protein DRQ16_04890 [bacterium]